MEDTQIIGFGDPNEVDSDDGYNNVPLKNKSKKGGGFQCMGLSDNVLKGITKRGYKLPTPIQRKTIPLALEGRDVVAMARTGSGKTACFLIPMFEKLKTRQAKVGARALILSPTRELALQTLKFIKELAKYTDLKASVVLGGDSMEDQFESIHSSPDIIVATPGRFLHICIEMDLKLDNIEYVVYDEADRLFEMGWGEQINEIANRLPESRQTLLFSATLPKVLVEFAKAGLSDPVLIRLDVESKLPNELKLSFITCRPEEKLAVLLCLLKYVIKKDSQTIVFAATMHHVEYIHMILDHANITNTFIYSNLDATARKINAAKFQAKVAKVLVVTDVAARGIDIPHLDNVINFNFPAKSKLFVHRVGRCARAGRTGTAYNIVSNDEYAYLLDLHLFLGSPFNIVPQQSTEKSIEGAIGKLPQSMIEQELAELITWHDNNTDLQNMQNVAKNGYQQYIRSRPAASTASVKRVKELDIANAGVHSEFADMAPKIDDLLTQMKSYRPRGTVFEVCKKPSSTDYKVMITKRAFHNDLITKFKSKQAERKENTLKIINSTKQESKLVTSTNDEINEAFKEVVKPKKRKIDDLYREPKKKKRGVRDEEFYIPYSAPDKHTEDGLAVNNFATSAEREQMDLTGDNEDAFRQQKQMKKWDRKKKKMVTVNNTSKVGKIRTESGAWISASFKSNRYQQWKDKSKIDSRDNDDDDDEEPEHMKKLKTTPNTHWARHNRKVKEKMRVKDELKRPEQIMKQRKIKEKKREREQQRRGKGKGKGRKKAGKR
ncbi:ATP-dependent RNA helicase DDX54 [Microplitis demolitor]|uniref:ATP-dependent RNA helicase DDX54 n=1 Tax=Microplitis demolitor TaxID=69319 RepID=UPI0004CCC7D4|nr:ATP-dependent RNA helicase DDX54 [Microplitis demolitor]XP_008553585.1 ATP-dependent RNA helicase DDX54 [Microplitis demolitor]